MPSMMSEHDALQLRQLLRRVELDRGWWPTEECVQAIRRIESTAALELVITRRANWGQEVLLRTYKEGVAAYIGALSFPGGYVKCGDRDKQATCTRIAKAELGMDVMYIRDFGVSHLWAPGEHPDGSRAFSCYVVCALQGEVTESEDLRFYSRKNLPTDPAKIVQPHYRFILENIF